MPSTILRLSVRPLVTDPNTDLTQAVLLNCSALYYTAVHCPTLHSIVIHWTVWYGTELHCAVQCKSLYCTVWHGIALQCIAHYRSKLESGTYARHLQPPNCPKSCQTKLRVRVIGRKRGNRNRVIVLMKARNLPHSQPPIFVVVTNVILRNYFLHLSDFS